MPEFPCWADRAARDYAAEQASLDAFDDAVTEVIDDLLPHTLEDVYAALDNSETEQLDEALKSYAYRILEQRAVDNEP